jgi:hypothetical protein
MRAWWLGAACLVAGMAAHAQGSVQQASPAAPTAAHARRARRVRRVRRAPATPSPITDHFALSGIFFLGNVSTDGQFNSGAGVPGTPFQAENILGLPNRTSQARADLMFRLEQRSRLRMNFLDLRRSGQALLAKPLQFGNQLFKANEEVQTEVDWRQTDFTYTYSVLRTDRYELGVGAGVHLLQAEAIGQVPHTPNRATYSAAGPFATLAVDGIVRVARDWSLSARGQYLKVTINSTTGMLAIYHADVQYRWRANFAVGAGYDYQRVEVNLAKSDPSGYVRLNISGPELFARLSF